MNRTGVLLINLGTPDEPTPKAVGRFLREFLMDGFVLDVPAPFRWFLVNLLIVPRRRKRSAGLYQKIYSEQGSPLLFHTRNLATEVTAHLSSKDHQYVVEFGMRYGSPSIASSLAKLRAANVARICVLPLYPQYAESSFETAVVETKRRARELGCADRLSFLPPFYAEPAFIKACTHQVSDYLKEQSPDHIVFSFHGVPVRHIKRLDQSRRHCLVKPDCCDGIGPINENCYRAQCVITARAIAQQLGLDKDSYTVSFQSRFGRAEWVGPATEDVLRNLAGHGVKSVAVFSPSFVADCLETLEEIAIRGRKLFLEAGGDELTLIPSLNTHPVWIEAVTNWIVELSNQSTPGNAG
jgi:ferrochelatase